MPDAAVAAETEPVDAGAGAFDYHHIQYLFHSYNVRDDDDDLAVAAGDVHVNAVFVVLEFVLVVQRSLNLHWQFQEVSRSSVKARCSGRHVLADEGDGAQRQRSGPGVYFGRLLNNARKQLKKIFKFVIFQFHFI